jgi:hypothetical protein
VAKSDKEIFNLAPQILGKPQPKSESPLVLRFSHAQGKTAAELAAIIERGLAKIRTALKGISDDRLWCPAFGGQC